jgi:hypothetical protein
MKTNVTIRIEDDVVQNAKILDLNISKISENALLQAIEEEKQPYGIAETSQIILEAELLFSIREKILLIHFTVINASDENVILDRINYLVSITDREYFSDLPDRQSIQMFKGTILERNTIPKGDRRSFSEQLIPSSTLSKRLSEVTYEDNRNLRWIVYPDLIVDSKKRVLHAKYEQIRDEKRSMFAIPRLLKTF